MNIVRATYRNKTISELPFLPFDYPTSQDHRNRQTTTNGPTTLQSTMVALRFSKEEFIHLGLRMASNWSEQTIENFSYKINKERLKDFYYASPRTLREICRDIQHEDLRDCQIKEPSL
jgi:hypothetical protein